MGHATLIRMNNIDPSQLQPQALSHDNRSNATSRTSELLLITALFFVGMNLRTAVSSVAPVLAEIRASTGLSSTGIGLLTTLPVLCFGVFAPFAPRLARLFSVERTILYCLLALIAGTGIRIFFGIPGLFTGTLIAGASVGIIMVLLPAVIKRDLPDKTELTTGIYTMALCLGAALAAGITVPLQNLVGGDWKLPLAFWTLPALLAAGVWWPQLHRGSRLGKAVQFKVTGLRKSWLAWQITMYMGCQSGLAYCVYGWLPTILVDRGIEPALAGFILSISIAMQLITSLTGPWIATRGRDQRLAIASMLVPTIAGLLGCLFAPTDSIWVWAILLGLGLGGSFSMGLALIVLRSPNANVAAALSGMAQSGGYSAAALGPLAVGILHGYSDNWNAVAIFFVLVTIGALTAAMGAGRRLHIDAKVERLN